MGSHCKMVLNLCQNATATLATELVNQSLAGCVGESKPHLPRSLPTQMGKSRLALVSADDPLLFAYASNPATDDAVATFAQTKISSRLFIPELASVVLSFTCSSSVLRSSSCATLPTFADGKLLMLNSLNTEVSLRCVGLIWNQPVDASSPKCRRPRLEVLARHLCILRRSLRSGREPTNLGVRWVKLRLVTYNNNATGTTYK